MTKPPLVFVHGAFCGGWAFEAFQKPFEAEGFETHAPDLPGHAPGDDPDRLATFGVRDYAEAIAGKVRALKTAPVLVGHSLGGLVAQIAAMSVEVAGIVLLAPSAPWGVMPTTVDEHSAHVGLSFLGDYWRRPVQPDYHIARHATLDRLELSEAKRTFARFVPESGRAVMETMHWWLDPSMASAAPANRIKAPVLAIGGGTDRVNPSTTVRRIAARFPEGQADFLSFRAMSHWLVGEPEWPEVADATLRWLERRAISRRTRKPKAAARGNSPAS